MKNEKERYENLLFDLPDYISGSLTDENRISEIETELSRNNEFKQEYESMKSTFHTLSKIELDEPSDAFFNNLIPKIHQKISEQNKKTEKTLWQKFFPTLKYVLPVICIVTFIYIYNFNNPSIVNISDTVLKNTDTKFQVTEKQIQTMEESNTDTGNSFKSAGNYSDNNTVKESIQQNNIYTVNAFEPMTEDASLFYGDYESEEGLNGIQIDNLSKEDEEAIISILNQEL